jgi:hypothetical protein
LEVADMLSVRNFGLRKIQFAVVALLLAIPLVAVAQVTTATMVGTITDPGGSIMPGAQVTARNVDTGLTRSVTSGDDGSYRLEFLPIGNYALEVTSSGFKKAYLSGIVLQVNDTLRTDVALTVGPSRRRRPRSTPALPRSGAPSNRPRSSRFRWWSATSTRCSI